MAVPAQGHKACGVRGSRDWPAPKPSAHSFLKVRCSCSQVLFSFLAETLSIQWRVGEQP